MFMNKTDQQKLQMLKHIFINPTACSINDLANDFTVSTRTITRHFSELQQDCQQLFSEEDFFLEKNEGLIEYLISPDLGVHYILDRLHIFYTDSSVEFRVIDALLFKNYTNINELAERLYLSTSSLYRILYKLEPLIEQFDLSFSFTENNVGINFKYEEKKLRLFAYYFYWSTLKGFRLDLLKMDNTTIEVLNQHIDWSTYTGLLPSKKEQLRYLWAITAVRQDKEQHDLLIPDDIQELLATFAYVNDLSVMYTPFQELPARHPERLFSNFFLRVAMSGLDSPQEIAEIVIELTESDSFITQKTTEFLSIIRSNFELNLSDEEYYHYYYYYFLTLLFIFYGDISLPKEFKEIDHLGVFDQAETKYTDSLLIQAQTFYLASDLANYIPSAHKQTIIGFICLMIDAKKKAPLTIAIHYSRNVMGESLIRQKLELLFSPESIDFTNDIESADLIIADCYTAPNLNKEFFYIDSLTDSLRWDSLFEFIKRSLTNRFFTA